MGLNEKYDEEKSNKTEEKHGRKKIISNKIGTQMEM